MHITLFEIFIFCPKIQLWFPEKIVDFFGWKTRENVLVLDFLAVDNFDFTRKIVKKKIGWKTRGVLTKLNFWTILVFRIVCGSCCLIRSKQNGFFFLFIKDYNFFFKAIYTKATEFPLSICCHLTYWVGKEKKNYHHQNFCKTCYPFLSHLGISSKR